ncbi:hypothetical protein SteCoe_2248 [Stentor coeruleus]|uniref:Tyrosine-protein kinase ephrin type A/B receptor-like domain-containing protein n=1 Tax=Stentor coeruleus TaxID=5963 RepID=A0A1R2D012_9CILI|nr:hypothetical protein SteCoe_2248 [Stentor coeruleus]
MLLIFLAIVQGFKISKIPESGTPPTRKYGSKAVYDPETNQIIIFGGYSVSQGIYVSNLDTFNLTGGFWDKIYPQSAFVPPGLKSSGIFLRNDRKIFVVFGEKSDGISSDTYSFNLDTRIWKQEYLSGYPIPGLKYFSYTSFTFSSNTYLALFGGASHIGRSNNIYLYFLYRINQNTLSCSILPQNGQIPESMIYPSISFYEDSLYVFGYPAFYDNMTNADSLFRYNLILETWEIVNVLSEKPEPRILHYSIIYNNEMYLLYGARIENSLAISTIWKYNFSSLKWTLLANNTDDYVDNYAMALVGSTVYLALGRNETNYYNSLYSLNLEDPLYNKKTISQNYDFPTGRKNHCAMVITDYLWIFGGQSEDGEFFNDIWEFSFTNLWWTRKNANGDIPEPRELFGCALIMGVNIYIFGGRNNDKIYNDGFYYQTNVNLWVTLGSLNFSPSPRYDLCAVYYQYNIFIVGGTDETNIFDEIWDYDYLNSMFYIISKDDEYKISLYGHKCVIISNDEFINIYTIGGKSIAGPNEKFLKTQVVLKDNYFTTNTSVISSEKVNLNHAGMINSNNQLFVIFGSKWDFYISPSLIMIDIESFNISEIASFPNERRDGSSLVQYGKEFYVFGGGTSTDDLIDNHISNTLFKITPEDDDNNLYNCSDGTTGENCEPCPTGYYCLHLEKMPCNKGTFSNQISNVHEVQCIPCDYQFYNDKLGASYCNQCNTNDFCPIGSISPVLKITVPAYKTSQPSAYTGKTSYINNLIKNLWIIAGVLASVTTFMLILIRSLWNKLKCIDMYTDAHEQELDKPIILRKTSVGGLFTIYFIIIAVISAIGLMMNYIMDNVQESKSLIPLVTLDEFVSAKNIIVITEFLVYGGYCINGLGECLSYNVVNDAGILFSSRIVKCYKYGKICEIHVNYKNAYIEKEAKIQFKMKENTSYSSGITVNISASSSIPDEISSIFVSLYPDDNKVFRGKTSSAVYFELIPSVFTSESSNWPSLETGYHIALQKSSEKGFQVTQDLVNIEPFLFLDVNLALTNTGLVTQRSNIYTWFIFAGGVLGTIFGLMETVSMFMGIFEGHYDSCKNKLKERSNLLRVSVSKKNLRCNFDEITDLKNENDGTFIISNYRTE